MKDSIDIKRASKCLSEEKYLYACKLDEQTCNEVGADMANLHDTEFKIKYHIDKSMVIMLGDTETISGVMIDQVVDVIFLSNGRKSYTCFGSDYKACKTHSPVIIHEDKKSSWSCLMSYMINPEYLIVYKDDTNII